MEPDDKMLCIDTLGYEDELTKGGVYKLMWGNATHLLIVNDLKEAAMFPSELFMEVKPIGSAHGPR